MATTSIWAVKGWLGKVVLYIENPEKTENPQFYRQKDMTDAQTQNLSDVIDYAARSDKTTAALDSESVPILRQLVSGINCLPATARDEMLAVKKRFGKEDGVVAYHGYQSFAPGEATPELAHEIGVKLARKLWGEKYQVLVSTHLDKENHLHSHFVVNTVSFVDGIRYHRTGKDYYEMRTVSDELCREYGLSVVEKPQLGKSKHYGEWRAEQEQRPTWRGLIRSEIDELIRESVSEKQFYYLLRQKGYAVKFGKDISVRPPGKERFVRLARNFGAAYTEDGIRRRILSQPLPQVPHPEAPKERKKVYSMGKWQKMRKITGFRALYLYYCYREPYAECGVSAGQRAGQHHALQLRNADSAESGTQRPGEAGGAFEHLPGADQLYHQRTGRLRPAALWRRTGALQKSVSEGHRAVPPDDHKTGREHYCRR